MNKVNKINVVLVYCILYASASFLLSSLVVFSTVAFAESFLYKVLGFWGAYLFWIVLFIILGGFLLHRLVKRFMTLWHFYIVYFVSFVLYSCAWILSYMYFRGYRGEWIGGICGSIVFALSFAIFFQMIDRFLIWATVFGLLHCAGYFIGNYCHSVLGNPAGMVLWGLFYGLGVGIGLGLLFYEIKERKIGNSL